MPGGPAGFTPDQLKSFSAPTLVVAAERDLFWRGHAAAAAACRLVPGCETVVLPGTKHLPAKHKLVEVNQRLLDFFASRSQAGMEE